MALFGKKKRTLDEILADIDSLTPEEKAKLQEKMSEPETSEGEPEVEKTKESAEVGAEGTPDDAAGASDVPSDDSVADPAPEADEATADPAPEVPAEDKAEDTASETFEAMAARLAVIEENYSTLIEKVEAMAERLDGGDFGNHRGTPPEGNEDAEGEESRIMSAYYRKQGDARRY